MPTKDIKIVGISASPGIAIGRAILLRQEQVTVERAQLAHEEDAEKEVLRLHKALSQTRAQVEAIQKGADKANAVYDVLNAYMMFLDDESLVTEVENRIREKKEYADWAVFAVTNHYAGIFQGKDDSYFQGRADDMIDLGQMVIKNIRGDSAPQSVCLLEPSIIISKDLAPSQTASMDPETVLGFVTDMGSQTSHSAIMAQSLDIPAVVGARNVTTFVRNLDQVIVDGIDGVVIINPSDEVLDEYKKKQRSYGQLQKELAKMVKLPAKTRDNYNVELAANIELPREIGRAVEKGAEGVGLYRTEFLFMNREELPTEEEQFQVYKQVAERCAPYHAIIRTVDLGGDKFITSPSLPEEMNPFLGWRAIRFSLEQPETFKDQLRAVLRASAYGKLKLMYPMISDIKEVRKANAILKEATEEVERRGEEFDREMEVGIMVEVPSTAINADVFAREVDFFSIGTNDLIQYTLAVDRVNERIAYLYEPFNPAVLSLIARTIDAAHKNRIWVGVCGEMAGNPLSAILLVGMCVDELSMSPINIPEVKLAIRSVSFAKMRRVAQEVLEMDTAGEIKRYLASCLPRESIKYLSSMRGMVGVGEKV